MVKLPDDMIPLLVAASRLQFGDDDFVSHATEVLTTQAVAYSGGQTRVVQTWIWPEIERRWRQIADLRIAGKIEIFARRRDDRSGELVPSPIGLWTPSDLKVMPAAPHEIYRAFNRDGHTGRIDTRYGIGTAEWYDPHVRWSDVERLIDPKLPQRGRPSNGAVIAAAFNELKEANEIDPLTKPKAALYPLIRRKITGDSKASKGLKDEAIRKVITPLIEVHKSP